MKTAGAPVASPTAHMQAPEMVAATSINASRRSTLLFRSSRFFIVMVFAFPDQSSRKSCSPPPVDAVGGSLKA